MVRGVPGMTRLARVPATSVVNIPMPTKRKKWTPLPFTANSATAPAAAPASAPPAWARRLKMPSRNSPPRMLVNSPTYAR